LSRCARSKSDGSEFLRERDHQRVSGSSSKRGQTDLTAVDE
jgi:hypothetical protein